MSKLANPVLLNQLPNPKPFLSSCCARWSSPEAPKPKAARPKGESKTAGATGFRVVGFSSGFRVIGFRALGEGLQGPKPLNPKTPKP